MNHHPALIPAVATRRDFIVGAAGGLCALALSACSEKDAAPAAPPVNDADEALRLVRGGSGFTVGAVMAANTVYVFFDTTCPHCAHLWQASQPLLGKLKMVWMPLGLLRPQSGPQGAAILGAADPVAAMNENEASVLAGGGGIAAKASPDEAVLAKVKANTDLFRRMGVESVPLILFRHAVTGKADKHEGSLTTAELAAAVGV
jgi:thiol:disulfide interchange protein DsbG